jgi:hypothetical protein
VYKIVTGRNAAHPDRHWQVELRKAKRVAAPDNLATWPADSPAE